MSAQQGGYLRLGGGTSYASAIAGEVRKPNLNAAFFVHRGGDREGNQWPPLEGVQETVDADIDARPGTTLLEFGSPYCGHCRRAEPLVEAAIAGRGGVSHVRVFDVFRGGRLPDGKKSLAFSIRYQAADRTLTSDDANREQTRILKRLERDFGATARG